MDKSTTLPSNRYHLLAAAVLALIALSTACEYGIREPTAVPDPPTNTPSPRPSLVPTDSPTPTPLPPKELTICQGEEPNTLFIYGGPSRGARHVLAAVYDGPFDTRDYELQPVILERVPSLETGDVAVKTVFVEQGDRVVNGEGDVVELLPGTTVYDADGQEVVFEEGVIGIPQMVLTFTLRAGVTWADGQPVTSEDSWFSYDLARRLGDASLEWRLNRTANYQVEDSRSVVWTSVPGYRDTHFVLNFYHPLPQHAIGDMSSELVAQSDVARQSPLGWGAFAIEEWADGDHISLVPNPHYFRASEGLPHLDRVTYRFVDDSRQAIDGLLSGECDVVTRDLTAEAELSSLAEADGVRLVTSASSEWEHLDFGVQPVQWSERPALFAEREVRQAIAQCLDRERIAREAFPYADVPVARSYVVGDHPLHAGDQLRGWPHDPASGRSMLEQAGWRDSDGDGVREAQEVPGVATGTPFSATLYTTEGDPVRDRGINVLKENLADCGLRLAVRRLPPEEFYADGPDGPVFGRQFDLALFSWLNGVSPPCELYMSGQMPREDNWWATSNNPGYASQEYDAACRSALTALYGTEDFVQGHREAQRILSNDLPVLPLYFVPKSVAVRSEVEGVILNPGELTPFWNIEAFDLAFGG